MKKLIIIDSFALIFRAYYAYPPTLITQDGTPINAAYGFSTIFIEILKKFKPEYLVAVFDSAKPTIRSTEFTQYKANRKETDLALTNQIPIVQQILETFDVPVLKVDGYEADDIIGTIVEQMKDSEGIEKIIVTGDQDIFQLIDQKTTVYLAGNKFSASKIYNRNEVYEKLNIYPEQVPTYKALAGDASDNIPGVAGVGPKTAVELISKFDTLENIFQNLDKIKDSTAKKLQESYEIAVKSLSLATIDRSVPVHFDLDSTKLNSADISRVKALFHEFRFNSLLKKLDEISGIFQQVEADLTLFSTQTINSYMSFQNLNDKAPKEIFIDYSIQNPEQNVSQFQLFKLFVSDGENIYQISQSEYREFFIWIQDKIFITYSAKQILHVIVNTLGLEFINKINFHDLGFATQVLSGGSFNTSMQSIFSFTKHNLDNSKEENASAGLSIFYKIYDELLKNKIYKLELEVLKSVVKLERNGICFDNSLAEEFMTIVQHRREELLAEIYDNVGYEFNLNSPKQVGDVLFNKRGLPLMGKTKGGSYSTDESTLQKLKDLDPVVHQILEYREVDKIYSTYITALPKYVLEGRIYTTFDQMGAISGRFASKNPNLQNIPTGTKAGVNIRNLFIPTVGYELIAFDYSQQELRILAALADETKMIEAFNEGIDIHALTASELYGVDISEVTKQQRNVGKVINFSIVYGVSAFGLSENLSIDVHTANEFINKFYVNYPKLKQYFDVQKEELYSKNYLETPLGRKRNTANFKSLNRFAQQAVQRELLNFPIQGGAADLMKEAMVAINNVISKYDARMLLQIHDEFLFEFRGNSNERLNFIDEVSTSMQNVTNLGVIYKVDVKSGMRWGEME
jgi:DNA polymerase-1